MCPKCVRAYKNKAIPGTRCKLMSLVYYYDRMLFNRAAPGNWSGRQGNASEGCDPQSCTTAVEMQLPIDCKSGSAS